ncbi:DUF3515 family protein [Microbacterium hydrocarbonoxydans]|uniref:DUF3515 family protein n=1 Tax=Microbacterium hydrocarbonoxydans TaxID=273678 RepID=UPI0020C8939B|nr:DUF3515 family protein [Microbacterium hydrocarbonoxydans]
MDDVVKLKILTSGAALCALLVLTSCAPTVHLEPAANANDPLCAEVTVRLPDSIGDQARVWTDAQATAGWGTPSSVLLTCGLEPRPHHAAMCQLGGRRLDRRRGGDPESAAHNLRPRSSCPGVRGHDHPVGGRGSRISCRGDPAAPQDR